MEAPRAPPPLEEYRYSPGFIVSHQKLEFDIDFARRSLVGHTEITILPQRRELKELRFNVRQCDVPESGILVNGRPADSLYEDAYEKLDIPDYLIQTAHQHEVQRDRLKGLVTTKPTPGELVIIIPRGVRIEDVNPFSEHAPSATRDRALATVRATSVAINGGSFSASTPIQTPKTGEDQSMRFAPLVVSIKFIVKNFRDGLHWVGVEDGDTRYPHVYTKHSLIPGIASCIFPCLDDPAMRCTWEIVVKCGRTLGDALKRPPSLKARKENGVSKVNGHNGPPDSQSNTIVDLSNDDKLLEMNVVCAGELTHELPDPNDSTKKIVSFLCSTQVGPQHIGFAVGPFEQVDLSEFREDEGNDKLGQKAVKVNGYCLPDRSEELRNTCETMAFAVDWFSLNFGSYPFPDYKLCFVDDQGSDTEPIAAMSLCSSRLLFPEDIIDPEVEVTRTLIHALASQWIGVSIIAAQRSDMWVVVGVSHFITELCMQKLSGNNEYRFRMKSQSDKLVELDIQRPSLFALGEILHLGQFEMDFMVLKAPLVLFILDRRLTKLSGSTGIARVISRLLYNASIGELTDKTVTTEGFRRLCEKIGHYKLDAFFNQWVMGAGCPRFLVTQKFNKKKLAVEMTISQKQDTLPTQRRLEKEAFLREFKEETNGVYAGDVQSVFTGPMTIRIHESDGTPYEHIVEIREGVQKIEIPYHTKYKRLKRSRREKERAAVGAGVDITADNHDDVLLYCLGDVLQSREEVKEWGLVDWDAELELKMESESYEWIRMDADFEWICELTMNMPSYMYLSQLQQDRDVVAQQDSMLFLGKSAPHPLVSTILIRTLMDRRYFHGIREMAADYLAIHATEGCNWIGRIHLEKAFQEFFCYTGSNMPRSNNFTDKTAYLIKCAIPKAMARVRDNNGKCPKEARQFILDQLRFNDNGNNEFSDYYYICTLMRAIAESLIPRKNDAAGTISFGFDEEDQDELISFQQAALEEIERYRRMDEWILSYQNIYTTTALDCKKMLMKSKVITPHPKDLFAYTHDGTIDLVRIKAFEALADLGFLQNDNLLKYFLNVMSTDSSPFLRDRLVKILFMALGAVALGERKKPETEPAPEEDGGLIIEDVSMEAKKAHVARTTSIEGALLALKEELEKNETFKKGLWDAVKSKEIGIYEQLEILDICSILYPPIESMIVRMKYPRYWKVKYLGKVCYCLFWMKLQRLTTN
jgi:transcription initiation factor TFIID subunit 2